MKFQPAAGLARSCDIGLKHKPVSLMQSAQFHACQFMYYYHKNYNVPFVICLPTEHHGVHKNSLRNIRAFQDRIGIWKCWFLRRGGNRSTGGKPLVEAENNNKLNPHMTPGPGIEPGTQWWENALTTAPSLLPSSTAIGLRKPLFSTNSLAILAKLLSYRKLVIGQFVTGQFNKSIAFKVVV